MGPLQVVVPYWEKSESELEELVAELRSEGLREVSSFLLWEGTSDSDSFAIVRFFKILVRNKIKLKLIITPELGLNLVNSAIPSDILAQRRNLAVSNTGSSVPIQLGPTLFFLPSLNSSTVTNRYFDFLHGFKSFLNSLERTNPEILSEIDLIVTGTFWKYYRSTDALDDPFDQMTGDFSKTTVSKEEELNFRNRVLEVFKGVRSVLKNVDLLVPEADPVFSTQKLLSAISGLPLASSFYSDYLDFALARRPFASKPLGTFVYWTALGEFTSYSARERAFLCVKSLVAAGSRGGGILVDGDEWRRLNRSLRRKLRTISALYNDRKIFMEDQVTYLTHHVWSSGGRLWNELAKIGRLRVRVVDILDENWLGSKLFVVDPNLRIEKESLLKLVSFAQSGMVVALPRSPYYSKEAMDYLEELSKTNRKFDIQLGISYQIQELGRGKLIVFDFPHTVSGQRELVESRCQLFLKAMFSLSGVKAFCRIDSAEVTALLDRGHKGSSSVLFLLNQSSKAVDISVEFDEKFSIYDFGRFLSDGVRPEEPLISETDELKLEIPEYGILPLFLKSERKEQSSDREL